MKNKHNNYHWIFSISLFFIICLLIGGCCLDPRHKNIQAGKGENFEREKNELRVLARICGIPQSKINMMTPLTLISEIKIKMSNSNGFYGRTLSDSDMNTLKSLLADEPQIERIVREYDSFIKRTKGHTVIILP